MVPPTEGVLHPTPRERAGLLILVWAGALLVALTPFVTGLLGALVLYVVFVRPNAWRRPHGSGYAAMMS